MTTQEPYLHVCRERDEMLTPHVYAEVPRRVEYELTVCGRARWISALPSKLLCYLRRGAAATKLSQCPPNTGASA